MAQTTRILTCAILLAALFAVLPGCTGFGGTTSGNNGGDGAGALGTVNVLLQYTDAVAPTAADVVTEKLPAEAVHFRVELLNQNTGITVIAVQVDRLPGDAQTVTLNGVPVGNYNLRVTAFDAGGTAIGVYVAPITVQTGTNTFPVPTVSPLVSPSPSPSPSPSVSPSPSPSPIP